MEVATSQQQQHEQEDEDGGYVSAPENAQQRDPLALPSPKVLKRIAERQDAQAAAVRARRADRRKSLGVGRTVEEDQDAAARLIQRNYRGHRTRRAMEGRGLDPSIRWMEV